MLLQADVAELYARQRRGFIQNMEDKKKARSEGEKQEVPKGQVRPRQEFTEAEDVRDVASERASVRSSTVDDHGEVQSVDSSSDNDYKQ